MSKSDAELVESWRSGDIAAFELLIRRNFDRAWAIAISVTHDGDEAEDVCSKAFVRCWERRDQCKDPTKFRAWFATIVRSVAYNHIRGPANRKVVSIAEVQLRDPRGADRDTKIADIRSVLLSGMEQLTTKQREVLVLSDLEGLKHSEIATQLRLSETTSRKHLSDARKLMRDYLQKRGLDEL